MNILSLETKELIKLKLGEKFLTPGNDLCTVLVKYNWNRITARNEGTKETVVFSGNLRIIPSTN